MIKRISSFLGILLALGLLTSCEEGPSQEQQQCEAEGGDWGPFGLLATMICYPRFEDAGQACTNSTQCQGACEVVYDDNGPTDRGMCAQTIMGGCVDYFNDLGEHEAICVD